MIVMHIFSLIVTTTLNSLPDDGRQSIVILAVVLKELHSHLGDGGDLAPRPERHQERAQPREQPPVAPLQAGGEQGLQRGRRAPLGGGGELQGEVGDVVLGVGEDGRLLRGQELDEGGEGAEGGEVLHGLEEVHGAGADLVDLQD